MPDTDVAVIGAGPAGAWAAWRLARGGAQVTILDPSHPREKPCGGGLTGRAAATRPTRRRLSRALPHVSVAVARFEYEARRAAVALPRRPGPPALVIASRRELDGALLAAACQAGATHLARRVRDVRRSGDGWALVTDEGPITADG